MRNQPAPNGIDFRDVLVATPTPNRAVRQEQRGDALVLFVPLRRRWWMSGPVSWWLPIRRERGVALDALGQEVWADCDGKRCVREIVQGFSDRHRLGFHEARLTVVKFLRMLAERRLLVLLGPAVSDTSDEGRGETPHADATDQPAKAGVA